MMKTMNVNHTTPAVISLDTACALSALSKSTWWRRIAKGDFTRVADDARGRAMLLWSEVAPHVCIAIAPEDQALVLQADAGQAEAQDDLGQLFSAAGKHQAAFYWFQLAAGQGQADAMQWLGRCYISGEGVKQDDNLGLMWLAKAAALGHEIAQGQMKGLTSHALGSHAASSVMRR
jgi:TPR repeat protein